MKHKIHIEYPLNPSSGTIIWAAISTPAGLERWFADEVSRKGKIFTFRWGKTETRNAEVINLRQESFVRFRWTDEKEPRVYFELKIHYNELTTDHLLEITDFAEPEELDGMKYLWDSQIETLKRQGGM